ncbi:MAG: YggT family protein [Chloroflexi bacterium]|nr:YggT family protein [Chloroflexota bacterium]
MSTVYLFLGYLFNALSFVVLARALISWFPLGPSNPIVVFLVGATEPLLAPLRRILPRFGMFDLSPLVAVIILQVMAKLSSSLA